MSKVRVYELAKELGIASKKLIEVLKELNVDVKNHMSTIDEDVARRIVDTLTKGGKKSVDIKKDEKESAITEKRRTATKARAIKDEVKSTISKGKDKKQEERIGRKQRKYKRIAAEEEKKKKRESIKQLMLDGKVTVAQLANKMDLRPTEVIKKLLELGVMATINQYLDEDTIILIAEEYGFQVEMQKDPIEEELQQHIDSNEGEDNLQPRCPVVTILGHVDHGKTSLLDAIRETNVIASEAGGITQHIGAYSVEINKKRIVFLDTPGHEAFTAMRARGAQVTDIAVLVVAADDGVMPQTVEAVNHAKAAGVPLIVALNKMDKRDANPEQVKKQLSDLGLIPEEWGGDTIYVPVSALKKEGLDQLLEMILLVAEMAELKANYNRPGRGVVVEAKLDKGRGPVATVLVQDGRVEVGDSIICGSYHGKVRAMLDDKGKRQKVALPSTPVEILGLNDVPQAGDEFFVAKDDKLARQIAAKRSEKEREASLRKMQKVSLDDFYKKMQEGEVKELNLIVKADTQGSVEALVESLLKLEENGVKVIIVHSGVGAVSESDVMLAVASHAIIIGFNVRPDSKARKLAEKEGVDIRLYRVIYEIIEDVKAAIKGLLVPEIKEVILGQAEVRQLFKVSKVGTVAGSYVKEGRITRNANVRVIRDNVVLHEGKINTLRRFKDDVREVSSGFECGILLENFNDLKEGDIIEAFSFEEVPLNS
ncbi:MAG: translation initiation factor IF-2 [Firmicutes bacterium]|nr:translation initiation factor IF-2 [Bacillota bacterium]